MPSKEGGSGVRTTGSVVQDRGAQAGEGVSQGQGVDGNGTGAFAVPHWVAWPPPAAVRRGALSSLSAKQTGGGTAVCGAEHPGVGVPRMDGVPVITCRVCQSRDVGAVGAAVAGVTGPCACRASLPAWSGVRGVTRAHGGRRCAVWGAGEAEQCWQMCSSAEGGVWGGGW